MISVNNVSYSFPSKKVLDDITFGLPNGKILGMIGPTGSGKSVLLKIIAGVLPAQIGEIKFDHNIRPSVSLMFQEGALFDSLSVYDNVAFPLADGRVPTYTLPKEKQEEIRAKVEVILSRVGLTKASAKMPAQLSGGMKRRVSLARALVAKPEIILLDDPTAGLDPVASSVIMDLIVEFHKEYDPITILVSHDLRRLLPVVDKVFALFNGKGKFVGDLADLRLSKDVDLTKFVSCRYDLRSSSNPA